MDDVGYIQWFRLRLPTIFFLKICTAGRTSISWSYCFRFCDVCASCGACELLLLCGCVVYVQEGMQHCNVQTVEGDAYVGGGSRCQFFNIYFKKG